MNEISREEFLTHVGFIREDVAGVHDRLDTLNGRTRTVETAIGSLQASHEARLAALERDAEAFHQHRRSTDRPPSPVPPAAEDKAVTRREIGIVVATVGTITGAILGAWKVIQWVVSGMKVGP